MAVMYAESGFNPSILNHQGSGAVGLIQRDEADYAICCFAGTYARSKVAAFSPGIDHQPLHWLTRYPRELSPIWNLFGLFTKGYNPQIYNSTLNLIWALFLLFK